jgi:hypothetical protein
VKRIRLLETNRKKKNMTKNKMISKNKKMSMKDILMLIKNLKNNIKINNIMIHLNIKLIMSINT